MQHKSIKAFAPATIANVGPGFDVLGLAINGLGDTVTAKRITGNELRFDMRTENSHLPLDKNNIAAHVAQLMLDTFKPDFGIEMTLHKNMPIGSGLGSSGASAAAAAMAVNALLEKPVSKKELIRFAASGEQLATGTAHADNVAPSILGGLCLIRSYEPLDVIQLPCSQQLYWIVAHPFMQIETKKARDLLPSNIPIANAIAQSSDLAALLQGLALGDSQLITASLRDHYAEPVRAKLIPGFDRVKAAAMAAQALGFSISGSGPSVFAIADNKYTADQIGLALKNAFQKYASLETTIYISTVNLRGAYILEEAT